MTKKNTDQINAPFSQGKEIDGRLFIPLFLILLVIGTSIYFIGIEGINRPVLPDHDLHYNYGVIKEVNGIWYKTTYFGFEDEVQSISVYYGSDLFDYVMDNVRTGDFVIVVWKWVNTEAETFSGYITVPWFESLVINGKTINL